ncbi:Hypothetical predicted protein [Mytilus galloprovincialis]|uniref:Zonadhesin n=1 Tax=Mytilus galloprovincialis TaxID=29158 RepID=A0A8B6D540_MYTGA|nr:Hypothetical predicted protein [Mytilus galloprovincialis]
MAARHGVFLLLLVIVIQTDASKRKEVICEDSKTTLSCPSNQVIKIRQAWYGRYNKRTCKHKSIKTTRCSTNKPRGITMKNCNGRKSCTVAANNRLYGDPCPGTHKYVTVTYYCKDKTPKCLRKCHRQAKCIRGKCVCNSGYKGDGIRSCTNIKVKKAPKCLRRCHRQAKCIRGKCVCKSGYKGDGIRSCTNIKVQTPKCRRKCHKKARCIKGKCVCKGKYKGDGVRSCKKVKLFKGSAYIGCYQDDSKRILSKKVLKDKRMTVQKCQQFCGQKGFKYAGVEYGFECFCGNVLRKDRKRKESDCKTPCAGNKRQICGGTWRISIYTVAKTSKCRNKCHKKAKCRKGKCVCKAKYQGDGVKSCKKVKRSAYIGCYRDDSKRILSKKVLKDKRMTVQKCQQFCGQKGFKYAGVEYGFECFCGNVLRKDRKRKESDCKKPCAGNKRQICGGTWRISIYTASSNWKCYHYTLANKLAIKLFGEKSICEKHGRKFTKGINKRYPGCGTCWCCQKAKGKPPKCRNKCHKKAKCRKGKCVCRSKYQGDGVKSCKKGKKSAYIGCYQDHSKRILPKAVLKDKSMTVQKCRQFCGKKGFKYAGVEYGIECFCGDVLRKNKKRKESDCKMPCSGNKQQICGGTWRISIYTGKPGSCKGKCHKNGKCKKGRCRCKRGYTGDGINVCFKSCTCSASGDPHYRTFDGQMLHFMGTCKYTLSQYVNSKSTCRFHVQVRNENRGNKRVSYTRSVHVVVRNTKIDLLKNRGVKVDGVKRYLPYKTGYFSIINSGRYVRLKTTCNVIITWDGRSAATISVPSHFSQNLIGLCGNCNGIKDDFRTKDGLDVRTKRDKFTLIGESYLIREGKDEKCGVSAPPDPCTPTLRNKATRNTVCGRLNPANSRSPFRDCSQEDMALVQDIYDSCIYDYCAYNDQPDMLNTIVCEAAEGLEERCENMGFDISWRTKQFCPFTCEDNMEYSSSVSGCPATCVDLDAPKTCKLPPSEGCQCKKGFVLSDNTCIPRAQCGCRLPTGDYYPIDTEITSRDCRTVSKCVAKKGYAKMQVIKRQRCHRNAQCKLLNGVYDCACEEGFKGDGIKKCKGKPEPGIEKVICEGLKGSISCPRKKTIRILEATYGRTDMSTCKDPRVKTTSCSSNKPLPIIRKNCDGIKSCMVSANNGLYGDPCGGTYKYVTVRYVCEETGPKCGSSVCHPDAKCHRGRCVCRKGFVGDGVNSCTETCTCIASGDPHYKSFDGQVIHFMGICTYTMVKSTSNDKCGGFEVQVQNEHRGANTKVSYTQYVLVKLADATIRLDKKNVVFVNDVQVYTPYSCTNFEITTSGRYVRLQTKCNILITWNGAGTVAVSVPKSYSGIVSGLCGDCNGKKDDFRTATGEDVSLKKDKFELIGQSYTVPGIYETKDKTCVVGPVPEDPCSAEESKKAASDKYCGLLNPKNYKSPFMSCAKKDMDMANGLYESCLYDYCSLVGSPELERIICESLEGYEEQCEDMGLSITWRRKDFCPLTCPENMEYSTSGSGSPATCVDPDAPLTCILPNTEGCQCKAGFFLSGNECVPKEQCGCRGPEGEYYPLGKQFTSSDCTIVTKCSSVHGKPSLTVVKNQICHQNAKCRLRRGQYRCICKRKFKGNGVDERHHANQNVRRDLFVISSENVDQKDTSRLRLYDVNESVGLMKGVLEENVDARKERHHANENVRRDLFVISSENVDQKDVNESVGLMKGVLEENVDARKERHHANQNVRRDLFVISSENVDQKDEHVELKTSRLRLYDVNESVGLMKGVLEENVDARKERHHANENVRRDLFVISSENVDQKDVNESVGLMKGVLEENVDARKERHHANENVGRDLFVISSENVDQKDVNESVGLMKGVLEENVDARKDVNESVGLMKGVLEENVDARKDTSRLRLYDLKTESVRYKQTKIVRYQKTSRLRLYDVNESVGLMKGVLEENVDARKERHHANQNVRRDLFVISSENVDQKDVNESVGLMKGVLEENVDARKDVNESVGLMKGKTPCKRKYQKGFVCNFLGKCRPNERCNADSCGVNAVCVKRKYCRCKRGYAGHPKTLCEEVKECLKNARGKDYNGRMSTTESGRTCQAWNKQTPHRHSKSNVRDAKNYCRNMDNEQRPWCYTTDSRKRWEFCRIPICGAPKPPCGDMVIMACHSDREHRTECIVPNAERINYIELTSGKDNPSCTFGVSYGFYGVKIWTKENCREKIKVCLTPKNRVPILPTPGECRKSTKGTEYKGRISLTKTGRTCQYWERQYPHKHRFSISFKKEHNYCRNPDNSGQPWCYTNDPTTRWEYCQIPMCAACSVREEIVECKATVRVSGSCFYKSKVGSSCVYTVQLTDSQAIIKTSTQEMVLTNGGNLAECAIFTFNDGTLKIEDDVCKCFKFKATMVNAA